MGGMRGNMGLLYETSKLHHLYGINYRGHDLPAIMKNVPKAKGGAEPIPEGVLWLLLTGDFPSESETTEFVEEMYKRGSLTDE